MNNKRSLLGGLFIQTMFAALFVNAIASTPSLAQNKALLIGNSKYGHCHGAVGTRCAVGADCVGTTGPCDATNGYAPLPGDAFDVLRKHNALEAVTGADAWQVVNKPDLDREGIINEIKNNKPTSPNKYFVWYSGHGLTSKYLCNGGTNHGLPCNSDADCPGGGTCQNAAQGELAGVDGLEVTPQDFVGAITTGGVGDVSNRTFVKLDSCGSGAFADAVNAINAAIGFQTAKTGLDCSQGGAAGSQFTTCYVEGMNGAADADGNDLVTVAEAAAYADVFCSFGGAQCSNNIDDDEDGKVNDGCPAVGPAAEVLCNNAVDDDLDGKVNDGCPKVGYAESKWDGDYANLVIGAPAVNTGFCTVNIPGKGAVCLRNLSKTDCEGKGGIWNETACIPTVSSWGVAVMAMLVLTAATVVIMRRRAMVRGGS